MNSMGRFFPVVLISTLVAFAMGASAGAALATDVSAFADASYIYIATVRKDGNQSRAVPVWFVTTGSNQILNRYQHG
jgi:hypothetical protein